MHVQYIGKKMYNDGEKAWQGNPATAKTLNYPRQWNEFDEMQVEMM